MAKVGAQIVGDVFVQLYYRILHHSPPLVHKFYQDVSKLGRPEDDGSMSITTTLEAINCKILSLNYDEFRADIKFVDAQESSDSGILVLVSGNLTRKDNISITRNFTQSFFLAPQEEGYFVLNDVFRYVENVNSHDGNKKAPCTTEFVDEVQDGSETVVESAIKIQKMPKKSYPSIVTDMASNSTLTSQTKFQETHSHRRNMVKKTESLGQSFDLVPPTNTELELEQSELFVGKGEEYEVFRQSANQHWDLRKSSYQKAITAHRNGKPQYATYLFEQGMLEAKMAREADERASQKIFTDRNKIFENTITIDLHGQRVKKAMWLLKRHLKFGTSLRSIRFLKVITGYGSNSGGKSKIKPTVINFLEKEGVEYKEENKGALVITIDGEKEFDFLGPDSDSD